MNRNSLQAFALELALSHKRITTSSLGNPFGKFAVTRQQEAVFDEYCTAAEKQRFAADIPNSATEWFIDNYYAIKMQLKSIRKALKNIPHDIPVLADGVMRGFPRIYALAVEYIDFTGGIVTQNGIMEFLEHYQKELVLTADELWSLSAVFSLALAKNIMAIAGRRYEALISEHNTRLSAESLCAEKNIRAASLDSYINVNDAARLATFISAIQNKPDCGDILRWLDSELAGLNMSANEILDFARHIESNCAITVRNSITSLMKINMLDWESIFSSAYAAEAVFNSEKCGIYKQMDAESKNIYRRKLKKTASRLHMSEEECAEQITEKANEKGCHIGHILFESNAKGSALKKCSYVLSLYALTFFIFIASLKALGSTSIPAIIYIVSAFLLFIPCKSIAKTAVSFVFSRLIKPARLCRLELENGIPGECKTTVVIPALIANTEQAAQLVENMEINYIANKSDNLYFALLGDYADSDCAVSVDDEQIKSFTADKINSLNKKYGKQIFFYMQRDRIFNSKQDRWFGWERKRGAVIQFNRFLCSGNTADFCFTSRGIDTITGSEYVITLDADTKMPIGSAAMLIGTAHHPLNKPVCEPATSTVISGYGILQPRMDTSLTSALKTSFARITAGNSGSEPYVNSVSEIYQDIFGKGSFAGKGIYSPKIFCEVIDGRFPENAILSHDMIEGGYLRSGYTSDIAFVDDTPSNYIAYRKRAHRWMRGDWQLIPYLLPFVKNSNGKKIYNCLDGITKYKIYENLQRTLFEPTLCLLLLAGVFFGKIFSITAVLYAVYAALPIMFELFEAARLKLTENANKRISADIILKPVLSLLVLADSAVNSIDAIIRTLARLKAKTKLLEWQTAMQAESGSKKSTGYYYNVMLYSVIFGAVLLAASLAVLHPALGITGTLFMLAPAVTFVLSKSKRPPKLTFSAEAEDMLELTAKGAWNYFRELCTEQTSYLPPDNLQTEPYKGAVMRTSPTNIGMLLSGCTAAEILGYASTEEAVALIHNALCSLVRLEKHNGQPYNWYDIRTLKPIEPLFISTADNGNLACCLIEVRQALEMYRSRPDSAEHLLKLNDCISMVNSLLGDMDFTFLYDAQKDLFSVGYDVREQKLSEYAYDMLSSEARQASFYAIITGQAPVKHWRRLSRIIVKRNGKYILKSWSGSMFEYLMPALLLKTYDKTLWSKAFDGIISEQIRYAKKAKRPWGISESGYWHFDADKYYQYKAFGIPYAAVRYTKTGEYVAAPYACALTLPFATEAAAKNLKRLKNMGLCSRFGFYEAVDMSDSENNIVRSHMAHHEGMSLLAAANCLKKDCIVELFHSAPEVKAGEILLQEKLPDVIQADAAPRRAVDKAPHIYEKNIEESFSGITLRPHCAILTNGTVSIVVSNSGANSAFVGNMLLNKWKSDVVSEAYGHFIFIRDMQSNTAYSVTPAPLYGKSTYSGVVFKPDSIAFVRKLHGLQTELNITVAPDRNAIIFKLSIKNTTARTRKLVVADYIEPALEAPEESYSHPAYSDMFTESRFDKEYSTVITERTPHVEGKTAQLLAVTAVCAKAKAIHPIMSRYDFIGRNKTLASPRFAEKSFNYANTTSSIIAPCVSLGIELELAQNENVEMSFVLSYADNYSDILNTARHFSGADSCAAAFELAFEHSKVLMQYKHIDAKLYKAINAVLSAIYYPQAYSKATSHCNKAQLWQFGISGDLPIICYKASESELRGLSLILKLFDIVSSGNVKAELVIITGDDGYHKSNYDAVTEYVSSSVCRDMLGKKGGIFIIRSELKPHDCALIADLAVISVNGSEASIYSQLICDEKYIRKENITVLPEPTHKEPEHEYSPEKLLFFNGYGGFDAEKNEYDIFLANGINTPAPWCNILANESFGTVLTESGGGYCWYKNSRENKLTTWCNDPVSDVPSEAIYIKDNASMQYITPSRIADNTGRYSVAYGIGYARYRRCASKLDVTQTVFVPPSDSVKVSLLEIKNESDSIKRLSVFYYADCNISPAVSRVRDSIASVTSLKDGMIYASNLNMPENGYMFIACSGKTDGALSQKTDFFGRTEGLAHPKALDYSSWKCSGEKRSADCLVIKTSLEVKPHCSERLVLLLGGAESLRDIRSVKNKYLPSARAVNALKHTVCHYSSLTLPFKITTNDKAIDMLFNNFLMYQVYVCRYRAKTSFYQCSGAYGFRDQLQDVLAFMYCDKAEARTHILRAACQQFEEGDVRHWWHESTGYGIRTKISDDLLFLPYVSCEYAMFSSDMQIFEEQVPFARGQLIQEGKSSDFGKAYFSENTASLYEHCMLAFKKAMRLGPHGLPLIGTGDWNDGFDKIGKNGTGESVWLSFFMYWVMQRFTAISAYFNKTDDMAYLAESCNILERGIKQSAWDGGWYRRAYYDDGSPVGSNECDECKIDVIAQAWAAIADITPPEQISLALDAAEKYLVDEKNGIVKLFSPPFKSTQHDPGYIKAYKSGIRENGGQYTHGAIWLAMAYAERGEAAKALRIIRLLNPVDHARTKATADKYKVEPYVVAADVYSAEGVEGMGGWTWYTGSAAWMYKVIIENILGIKIKGDTMTISPVVDSSMLPYRVEYEHRKNGIVTTYTIDVFAAAKSCCTLDGNSCKNGVIPLCTDGQKHKIAVNIRLD